MTIDKAIEILTIVGSGSFNLDSDDVKDASKLGIEALRSVLNCRKIGLHHEAKLLPGETEE